MIYFLVFVFGGLLGGVIVHFVKSGASAAELADWKTRLEASFEKDAATARIAVSLVVSDIKKKL